MKENEFAETVTIEIDNEVHNVPKGYTLATAITSIKGMNYRKTRYGDPRGPVCHMGVCFECSVFLEREGNIRACMRQAENGMVVYTNSDFHGLVPEDGNENGATKDEADDVSLVATEDKEIFDVVIIGAGPGGMGAAEELCGKGLQIAIVDEQEHTGGQIYRHVPKSFRKSDPHPLVTRVEQLDELHWRIGSAVWSIVPCMETGFPSTSMKEKDMYKIFFENESSILTKKIIIATGAYDRMLPFSGWTKPGVMSAGGLQILAKTQNFVPGEAVLLAGSHPFLLVVAKQIIEHGGKIKGIAFSQSFPKISELFSYGASGLRKWKKSKELLDAFQAVRKAKVPIWFNTVPVKAYGEERVTQLQLSKVTKSCFINEESSQMINCDIVGLCYGFIASSELTRQIGSNHYYDEQNGGWLVYVDDFMHSSVEGVYVVGELTGVGGAELSEIEGRIAGLSILNKMGLSVDQRRSSLVNERASWLSFAKMLGRATRVTFDSIQLLEQKPEIYVCRCEQVTFNQISQTLTEHPHLTSMNAIKLMTRCGMGLCQGRYCESTLKKIAEKKLDSPIGNDSLSSRFPTKPVTIQHFLNR